MWNSLPNGMYISPRITVEGVHGVEEHVEPALHPQVRRRQRQPRDRHREQSGQREEVARPLRRQRAGVAQPSAEEDEHARQHQHRGDVEQVERDPADHAAAVEAERADLADDRPVLAAVLAHRLEVQQPEHQRERDQRGEDATPEHELMGEPSAPRPTPDERLRRAGCSPPAQGARRRCGPGDRAVGTPPTPDGSAAPSAVAAARSGTGRPRRRWRRGCRTGSRRARRRTSGGCRCRGRRSRAATSTATTPHVAARRSIVASWLTPGTSVRVRSFPTPSRAGAHVADRAGLSTGAGLEQRSDLREEPPDHRCRLTRVLLGHWRADEELGEQFAAELTT